MTAEEARLRILRGIEGARHSEPFRWGGAVYRARVPTRLQLQIAHGAVEKFGAIGWVASLAAQCTELDGQAVFKPDDFGRLLHDMPCGFLDAFNQAVVPFLNPPVLPRAMDTAGPAR